MKFIDLFAGIGGFRRGLELAGHECVGFCEIDKFAVASYTSMHLITDEQREYLSTLDMKTRQKEILKEEYRNGEWYADDIGTVSARDIPRADIWCFGFPCQDISVAGKGIGFRGNRSSLFFRVMYLVSQIPEEERPTYLIAENVKNLLAVNGGWDFARVLVEMDRLGYDVEWQLLNSKNFGVPQNRERVFVVGHLRSRPAAEIFPIEGTNRADQIHQIGKSPSAIRDNPQTRRVYGPDGCDPTLGTMGGGHTEPHTVVAVGNTNPSGGGINGNCYFSGGLNPTLTTNKGEGNKIAIPVLTPERSEKRQNGRRFKEDGDPSFTLTGQDRHGVAVGINISTGIQSGELTQTATTVSARDYKGIPGGWQKQTAVAIEVDKDD